MVSIRPPVEADYAAVRQMVIDAHLDPTTRLHWEHVLVAEVDGKVVGVGQIKHLRGCQELGTLVVLPEYRRQGIAAQLIAGLEATAERPLYLVCPQKTMEAYYARFGYKRVPYREIPTALKLKLVLAVFPLLFGFRIIAMRKN
jgi:amino-acid N-acetyltransferase